MSNPIIIEQKIHAPVYKVWKALTDRAEMSYWYFEINDFELKKGLVFNFYEPGEEKKYHHRSEILEIMPNEKLKYSWTYPELTDKRTTVSWELHPDGNGTSVKLIHEDVDQFSRLGEHFSRDSFKEGWEGIIIHSLTPYLEK